MTVNSFSMTEVCHLPEQCSDSRASRDVPGCGNQPIGDWTGGTDVDTGATNRKLGSDMADSVTGGGLHGKDLSKADVSINIYCFLKARKQVPVEISCAIGDTVIDGKPYSEM
jgi:S-adenosylmethionine synthetase